MLNLMRVLSPEQATITHVVAPNGNHVAVQGFVAEPNKVIPYRDIGDPMSRVAVARAEDGGMLFVCQAGHVHSQHDCELETYFRFPESEAEAFDMAAKALPGMEPVYGERIKDGVWRVLLKL